MDTDRRAARVHARTCSCMNAELMDAFDREARVWSPVWSPEKDAAKMNGEGLAPVDCATMRW